MSGKPGGMEMYNPSGPNMGCSGISIMANGKPKLIFIIRNGGVRGAAVRESGEFTHEDRQWDTDFFLQGSFQKHFKAYHLLVNGKYAYDFLHYLSDPRKDVTTMYVNNHFRQHELYFSAANMFSILPFWSADISVDFQ